jgi:hypothetical protein
MQKSRRNKGCSGLGVSVFLCALLWARSLWFSKNGRRQAALEQKPILDDYYAAFHDSDGFFTDVRESDWRMMMERTISTPDCADDCRGEEPHKWFQNNWEPSFTCLHERRIGRWGDGGKWVCDPHRIAKKPNGDHCLVYSIGSNNDFSFEESVLRDISRDCEIHTFDHTIGPSPSNLPKDGDIRFHPWGLADADNGTSSSRTMQTIMEDLGHGNTEIDILKIDCDKCEWITFPSWFDGNVSIRQIVVELHGYTEGKMQPPAMRLMTFLKQHGYVIFHKEPNTIGCRGACIEYSFLRLVKPEVRLL